MRPAPAAKRASRTVSRASRGTKTTSLRFRCSSFVRKRRPYVRPRRLRSKAGGGAGWPQGLGRWILELVDLGALQLPRVVDVDRLPLGVEVERRLPGLAMPVAGPLRAAEREMHLRPRRARVDVRDPRIEVAHRAERLVYVAGEDRGREAELDRVRSADRIVDVRCTDESRRVPEDLFLRDPHLGIDVAEDRRPVEEALVEAVT